jgi:oligopeptide transport system substrate-binding protein
MLMGLTQDAADGTTIPGMAESWDTSADGLTWTFHLRKAQWSDGTPVTADDFVYSLRRMMTPGVASEYAYLLYFLKNALPVNEGRMPPQALGVRAIDARTLEIRLEHPAPYLPELAKHTSMLPVPRWAVEKWGDAWTEPGHFVSNGAYTLVDWKLGDYVRVAKNPRFYDADKVCFDRVDYYPTVDSVSAERRVARGELDANDDFQSNRLSLLQKTIPTYVRTHTYIGVTYLAFNTHVPALKDQRVRMAIDMAIDRDFIASKLLRSGQLPAYTFTPPGVANALPADPPLWASWSLARRQAAARVLLARAGFGPGHPLKLEIKHRNTPDPTLVMPAIQADLKDVGIEATLAQNEVQIAYQAYRMRDFQLADAAWVGDFNDAMSFLGLQQSATGEQNYGDYNNPRYDALLKAADDEPDIHRRAEDMRRAETLMLADPPVVPLYFIVNKALVNPNVSGWTDNIVDHHRRRWMCGGIPPVP